MIMLDHQSCLIGGMEAKISKSGRESVCMLQVFKLRCCEFDFRFPISPTLSSFLGSHFSSARPIWSRIDRLDLRPKIGPNSFRVVLSVPIKQSLQRKWDSLYSTNFTTHAATQSPRSWVRFLVSSDFIRYNLVFRLDWSNLIMDSSSKRVFYSKIFKTCTESE